MAYNKIVYGGQTLIDLTSDTVTDASHIMSGHTGHLADGTVVEGTGSGGETVYELDMEDVLTNGLPDGIPCNQNVLFKHIGANKIVFKSAQTLTNYVFPSGEVCILYRMYDEEYPEEGDYLSFEDGYEYYQFDIAGKLPISPSQKNSLGDGTYYVYYVPDFTNAFYDAQTSDATATADDISSGKTAYVNGSKLTGNLVTLDTSDATASASTILDGYTAYVKGQKVTGTASGSSGAVSLVYGGTNAVLVDDYSETFTLADTSFVCGTTAPSSSTTIKSSVSKRFTGTTYAYGDKDIIFIQKVVIQPTHSSSATLKAMQIKTVYQQVVYFGKAQTTYDTSYTYRTSGSSSEYFSRLNYYATGGSKSITQTYSYGFGISPYTPSCSSTSANSCYVHCASPGLTCRYSSSYESQANMLLVTDCTWDWSVKVYAVDSGSSIGSQILKDVFGEIF